MQLSSTLFVEHNNSPWPNLNNNVRRENFMIMQRASRQSLTLQVKEKLH